MLVMTCAIGKFTFEPDTSLSLAKLVRDSITAQLLAPKPREIRINSVEDAHNFVRAMDSDLVSRIGFDLELNEFAKDQILYLRVRDFAASSRLTGRVLKELAKSFELTLPEVMALLNKVRREYQAVA